MGVDGAGAVQPLRVLTITNMYPQPDRPRLGTFVEEEVVSLRRRGLCVDVLFLDGPAARRNYLAGPGAVRRKLAEAEPYDVIHAHYVFCGLIALAARRPVPRGQTDAAGRHAARHRNTARLDRAAQSFRQSPGRLHDCDLAQGGAGAGHGERRPLRGDSVRGRHRRISARGAGGRTPGAGPAGGRPDHLVRGRARGPKSVSR